MSRIKEFIRKYEIKFYKKNFLIFCIPFVALIVFSIFLTGNAHLDFHGPHPEMDSSTYCDVDGCGNLSPAEEDSEYQKHREELQQSKELENKHQEDLKRWEDKYNDSDIDESAFRWD